MHLRHRFVPVVSLLLLGSCAGDLSTPDSNGGLLPAAGETPVDTTLSEGTMEFSEFFPGTTSVPTRSRLWRLSYEQYNNALSELIGRPVTPTTDLEFSAQTESARGWLNEQEFLDIDDNLARHFNAAAEAYAATLAAQIPSCPSGDEVCLTQAIAGFAKRVWRRPITDEELTRNNTTFAAATSQFGEEAAREILAEAALLSPNFLFRSEVGDQSRFDGTLVRMTPHEIASALSFSLWNRPPDATLMQLADSAQLDQAATIAEQARRLLDDPRSNDGLYGYFSQWLGFYKVDGIEKDTEFFPEWTQTTRDAMKAETRSFIDQVLANGSNFKELLTAPYSMPPAELGWIYDQATDGSQISLQNRAGLLMQPSFLSVQANRFETSPTLRGVFVVRKLACFEPPPPDPTVAGTTPEPDRTKTTRDRYAAHQRDAACRACHELFDPIGLTFENFDAVGQFRTTENDLPIDPTGTLGAGILGPEPVYFENALDAVNVISETPKSHQCFAQKMFHYFYGRQPQETDHPLLRAAMSQFVASQLSMKELLTAFVSANEFVVRTPSLTQ